MSLIDLDKFAAPLGLGSTEVYWAVAEGHCTFHVYRNSMRIESGHAGSTFTTLELKGGLGFWGLCSPADWRMDGKGGP